MFAREIEKFIEPWREFDRMSRLFSRTASNGRTEFPAVNVWANGDHAVITTEIPGIDRNAIDISVSGNTVTLRGSSPETEIKEGESYHRHEHRHGDFNKTVKLPFNIDSGKVSASYRSGILQITLPQLEEDKPKKIEIKSE